MSRLEDSNSIAGIKTKSNKYLKVSRGFSKFCHYQKPRHMLGINDYQLVDYAYQSKDYDSDVMAQEFILEDEVTLRGDNLFIFDMILVHEEMKYLIVHKSPYIENNKVAGSFFHTILLSQPTKQTIKSYLSNPDMSISGHTKKHLDILALAPSRKYKLTQREIQCLKLLVAGHSARSIGAILKLSTRTIEFYIRNIKDKLNVRKVSEVIALTLSEGII